MTEVTVETNAICQHISRLLQDSPHTHGIIREIQRWNFNSGPQWTLNRLKQLKTATIQFLSTERSKARRERKFNCPTWVSKDKNGYPKGHLGAFIQHASNGDERDISLLISVLNTYTVFISDEVTEAQKVKFLEAISGKPNEGFDENAIDIAGRIINDLTIPRKWSVIFSTNYKETFSFAGLNTAKPSLSPLSVQKTRAQKRVRKWHPWILSFIESTMVRGPFSPILSSMGVPTFTGTQPSPYMGKITVLQEKGFKARVIAMPISGAQVAFRPLHIALNSILRQIPEDCTYSQESGVDWAAQQLRLGKTVHAVDLSSATDNFPLALQLEVLKAIGYPRVQEFYQICRSKWQSDFGDLVYTKGQPMGLYGSFPLFALSHHVLMRGIESYYRVSDTYRILGDDIVISNDDVAEMYKDTLHFMNVPISLDKTISSDLFTEFAGKLVSPNGIIQTVKVPSSRGPFIGVDNFLSYSRTTGSLSSIGSVPKQYRDIAKSIASIPIELGGAGVNPQGLSLSERLTNLIQTIEKVPKFKDLNASLLEFRLGGHPLVRQVTDYLSVQLRLIEEEISSRLNEVAPDLKNLATDKRSLLYQVMSSSDGSVSFLGTINDIDAEKYSPIQDWKSYTSGGELKHSLLNVLDNLDRIEKDNPKVFELIEKATKPTPQYLNPGMSRTLRRPSR